MRDAQRCERCGEQIREDAPSGLCPRCLLQLGVEAGLAWSDAETITDAPGTRQTIGPDRFVDRLGEGMGSIGPYRLIDRLGEGGMGVVYLAEQSSPIQRRVALKLVQPGLDSAQVLARFESERQALALLQHGGIAAILDAGSTPGGRPFFVMEYVPGIAITTFCDQRRLPIRARLALFLQVCAAVQHAHHRGIIHRDLKPSNILVMEDEGAPVAKIIDFGVAKALGGRLGDRTALTHRHLILGTPEYMSPEQASGIDVDVRTDIYSLGIVLYELLVGARPFEPRELGEAAVVAMIRMLREKDPPRLAMRIGDLGGTAGQIAERRRADPRSLARELRGDLEWITLHALEKEPARRYASASEFGADVRRHLDSEPVLAGPPSFGYRVGKLAHRHRALAAAAAAIVVAFVVAAIVSTLFGIRAENSRRETNRQLIASLVSKGMALVDTGDPLRALVYLTRALELEEDRERERVHRTRIANLLARSPRIVQLWAQGSRITAFDAAPTEAYVSGGADGSVRVWSLSGGGAVGGEIRHGAGIVDVAISADGSLVAAAGSDGLARVWRTRDGGPVTPALQHTGEVTRVALSPDGTLMATGSADGTVRVWDVGSGMPSAELRHAGPITRLRFFPDGQRIATASADGTARVWAARTGRPTTEPIRSAGQRRVTMEDVDVSPDGRLVATASTDFTAQIWDAVTGASASPPMSHSNSVMSVRFSSDGLAVVTTTTDRTTRVWRPDGTPLSGVLQNRGYGNIADWGPHGFVAVATGRGDVELWSPGGERSIPLLPHADEVLAARFAGSGRFVVSASADGFVHVWDLTPGLPLEPGIQQEENDFSWKVDFTASRSLAVLTGNLPERHSLRVFDIENGAPLTPEMRLGAPRIPMARMAAMALSPDGQRLAMVDGSRAQVWDTRSGEPTSPTVEHDATVHLVRFSPDGQLVATAGGSGPAGEVRVWNAQTGALRLGPFAYRRPVTAVAFTHDGRRLMTATEEESQNLKLWDLQSGRVVAETTHPAGVTDAVLNPADTAVWSVGLDRRARMWRIDASQEAPAARLDLGGESIVVRISPDGNQVITGSVGGEVRVMHTQTGEAALWPMRHEGGLVSDATFSPDGTWVVTSGQDFTARVWDVASGEPLTAPLFVGGFVHDTAVAPDGGFWAWPSGGGAYLMPVISEERPSAELSRLAQVVAGFDLERSSIERPLTADQTLSRWRSLPAAPPGDDGNRATWLRWIAKREWVRQRVTTSQAALDELRSIAPLRWPEVMQRLGAFALAKRWGDALEELRARRQWQNGSPEFAFFEAVSLASDNDWPAVIRVCQELLAAHRDTRNPDRAFWIVRACLLARDGPVDWPAVRALAERTVGPMPDHTTPDSLSAAVLMREGRLREAIATLTNVVDTAPVWLPPHPLLFLASAHAAAGNNVAAQGRLRQADALDWRPRVRWVYVGPWFEAEAALLRDGVRAPRGRIGR